MSRPLSQGQSRIAPALVVATAVLVALVVAALCAPPVRAAEDAPIAAWSRQSPANSPAARSGAALAFDQASGNLVLFGGTVNRRPLGDTWTYDGDTWAKQSPKVSPPSRSGASMAYDPRLGKVVLFAGGDTWTWEGDTWAKQSPKASPPSRYGAAMEFDPGSGKLVLFGGRSLDGGVLDDTWTYDGETWERLALRTYPAGREGASMAYDPARGKLILFGGRIYSGLIDDTWSFDDGTWKRQSAVNPPPAREGASLSFDPTSGELLLFGGNGNYGPLDDSWAFDGRRWSATASAARPSARSRSAIGFDPANASLVLFGGTGAGGVELGDTWTYRIPEGAKPTWTRRSSPITPAKRAEANLTFDPAIGKLILFGGKDNSPHTPYAYDDTWTYEKGLWTQLSPQTSPLSRGSASMAFDPGSGKIVLFGGSHASFHHEAFSLDDTWTFDGKNWKRESPAQSPPAREDASMAFDPALGKIVLFGGHKVVPRRVGIDLDDTWTYDGKNWKRVSPAQSPPARSGASVAFDPALGKIVLFGGDGLNDTWTFDGRSWTKLTPPQSPPGQRYAPMSFDQATGKLVLFGRDIEARDSKGRAETWTFDGTTWTEQKLAPDPAPRRLAAMDFDQSTGEIVIFGGFDERRSALDDTWTYRQAFDPPSAKIASPASGGDYVVGQEVETAFSCHDSRGAPGIRTCADSNGSGPPSGALDTSTIGAQRYTVRAVSEDGLADRAEISYRVHKAKPALAADASGPITIGGRISDAAILSGGYRAGGTIAFRVYGPDDAECSGAPAFEASAAVSGAGDYSTPAFLPTAPGPYRFTVSYSGDGFNESAVVPCGAAGQSVNVAKAAPSLAAEASGPVTIGGRISDAAILSGAYRAGGTIAFRVYGPDDAECSGAPAFESSEGVTGEGTYETPAFTPGAPGAYRFTVSYSGDALNQGAGVSCGAAGQTVSVSKAVPELRGEASGPVVIGGRISDSATIAGGFQAGGTLTFRAYGPDDLECLGAPAYTSEAIAVSGSGAYGSAPAFTPTEPGTYRFTVAYSGDPQNEAASTPCNAVDQSVTVVKAGPLLSATASDPVVIGGRIAATATLAGGNGPTGTLTFRAYGPEDPECAGAPAYTSEPVAVSGNGAYALAPAYTPTLPGTYRFTVAYSGDAQNEAAAVPCDASGASVEVTRASTSTSIAYSGDESRVTLTARVGGSAPSGVVTFTSSGAVLGTVPVAGATASLVVALGPGPHRLAAAYSGDVTNSASASPEVEIVIPSPTPGPGPTPGPVPVPDPGRPTVAPVASPAAPSVSASLEIQNRGGRKGRAKYLFRLTASAGGERFVCALDSAQPKACGARVLYRGLKPGRHRFSARAVSSDGLESAPAKVTFFVPRRAAASAG